MSRFCFPKRRIIKLPTNTCSTEASTVTRSSSIASMKAVASA